MNIKRYEIIVVLGVVFILLAGFGFVYGMQFFRNFADTQQNKFAAQQRMTEQQIPAPVQAPISVQNQVPPSAGTRVPVLMYHYIGDFPANADRMRRDLTVSTANFIAQMDYLKNNGYHTITTKQLYDFSQGKFVLPSKPIVLTFDDGYLGAFQNAVPVLKERGMAGVFAVITDYPDPNSAVYASWNLILGAQRDGMEIIPHTKHHIDIDDKKYTEQQRIDEVQGSILDIEEKTGVKPVAFIYPYGHHNPYEETLLSASGIKLAFTTDYGWYTTAESQLEVPRVRVHGSETLQRFEDLLLGKKIQTSLK